MASGKTITIVGFSLVFIYVIVQICNFYGVSTDQYGIYLTFLLFMLLSVVVLPNKESSLKYSAD